MSHVWNGFVQIITAIIVIAIIAVIVSKKSSSVQVIQSGTNAFDSLLKIILTPIQQGSFSSLSVGGITGSGAPYGFN